MEVLQGFVNPHAPLSNPPECLGQIVDLRITCPWRPATPRRFSQDDEVAVRERASNGH